MVESGDLLRLSRNTAFAGVAGAVALTALAAPLIAACHPMVALLLRGFFSRVCDQNPARSFVLYGMPVAVCVRCLGIYCGVAVGAAFAPLLRVGEIAVRRIFLSAIVLSLLDAGGEALGVHGNLPLPRFCLGALLGIASGVLLAGSTPPVPSTTLPRES